MYHIFWEQCRQDKKQDEDILLALAKDRRGPADMRDNLLADRTRKSFTKPS